MNLETIEQQRQGCDTLEFGGIEKPDSAIAEVVSSDDIVLSDYGASALAAYSTKAYDSTADYWKLVKIYDGYNLRF